LPKHERILACHFADQSQVFWIVSEVDAVLNLEMRNLSVALLFLTLVGLASARTWTDVTGKEVEGEIIRLVADTVELRLTNGELLQVKLGTLSAEDQDYVVQSVNSKSAQIALAVKRIDAAVEAGLAEQGLEYNEGLNDHMFLRRVYLDIAGRIPNFEEAEAFLKSTNIKKRQQLLAKLLTSHDYVSHSYNHFADLLRIQSTVPGTQLRTERFSGWLKNHLRENTAYNRWVQAMITSEGRIWENPAAAYHLRDNGMKLDHVSFMTKVFLGTDISCAQCHDDPFTDWTQFQYYELAAFFGDLETKGGIPATNAKQGAPKNFNLTREQLSAAIKRKEKINTKGSAGQQKLRQATNRYNRAWREMTAANQLAVRTVTDQKLRLPETYDYEDAKPNSVVPPRTPFGKEAKPTGPNRERLAEWLISPENPRFAMNIANRMWARFFGRGVAEPLHDIDPSMAGNQQLLETLSKEMVNLDYDLRAFTWAIVNTKAYNRLATRTKMDESKPYFFQGPILRRMTAEQTWDSLVTMMLDDPNRFRARNGEAYNNLINLVATGPLTPDQAYDRIKRYMAFNPNSNIKNGQGQSVMAAANVTLKKGQKPNAAQRAALLTKDAQSKGMTLARASELPSPAPQDHFLQKFGQSERTFIVDANSLDGSVPQIMELMNGYAQQILTQPNSRIFIKMKRETKPIERAEIVFLSILTRQMLAAERKLLIKELERGDAGFSDLIWALLNTPEFLFIK
jgi:hypothetical protein